MGGCGFALCGIPLALIDQGATDLKAVSKNCGVDDAGLGPLLAAHRLRRVIAAYVGENKELP
ncbi:CoA-transferase [Nocardia sp. NPDC052278]|uniref:CoA-transferase n=1 Tax=unclassified Nocardia TaxID=2637762 RepID=UPI0036AA2054